MKTKLGFFEKTVCNVRIIVFLVVFSLLGSCSNSSNPLGPVVILKSLDEAGGVISLGNIHLFVPAGALGTTVSFEIEEISSPAPPPLGWVQVGQSFEVRPGDSGFGEMALGIEFPGTGSDSLFGHRARICRFDETGRWVAVPTSGSIFPEAIWGSLYVLGIFAVHVENGSGIEDDIVAEIKLSSRHVAPSSWATEVLTQFFNYDMTIGLSGTGGPVLIGDFSLDLDNDNFFSYFSNLHEIQLNTNYTVYSPAGEDVPSFQDTVKSLKRELVFSSPVGMFFEIGKDDVYSITWSGGGPEWILFEFSGEGVDGSLVKEEAFIPNAGNYVFSAEELSHFKLGTEVSISAKLTQVVEISCVGFHSRSFCVLESSSQIGVMLR